MVPGVPRLSFHLIWVATAAILVFWRLAFSSLMDPDEAHYAQLTREMLASGNWLVPLLDGQPYIDKPFLFHWLQGASITVLGESEFAARLPSAIAALALIGITRWVGTALFDAGVGRWGAMMFATIPATFALAGIALLDMVFTAFLFAAVSCLLVAARERRPALEVAGYGLLALAVMTKGPVALVLVGLFCCAAWACGGSLRAWVRLLRWKRGLLLATLAASPWFLWMSLRYGRAFVEGYFVVGNLHYVTQPSSFSNRAISHTYFARAFAGGFFPWSAIVAGRAIDLALRRRSAAPVPVEEKLLWLWALLVIGFFSAARFKLDHYIFPAAPAFCLIAARAWQNAALAEPARARGTHLSVLGLGGGLIFAGTFLSVYLFDLNLYLPSSAIILPMILAVGGVAVLAAAAKSNWRVPATPRALVVTMLCVFGVVMTIGYPTLDRAKPTALLANTLRRMTPADAPTAMYKLDPWRASLRYYAARPLAQLSSPEDLRAFAARERPVYLFMIRRDYRLLRKSFGLREVCRARAVVRTTRIKAGLRRQHWDDLVVVTNAPLRMARPWLPKRPALWRILP
jgi:4-amino-4-deoxy-L-arabinose transferase-like glycosyltransferase